MKINKIQINQFGKLKDYEIEFKDGLNIIYGDNEAGKSTLLTFIKTSLYGIASSKRSISENNRLKYMPWGEKKATGELHISEQAKEIIIKRSFASKKSSDSTEILNSVSGEIIKGIDESTPGKSILGIGEATFHKTSLIQQLSSGINKTDNDEILSHLTNLKGTGDADTSYEQAIKILEDYKKKITNTARKPGKLDILIDHKNELLEEKAHINNLHNNFKTRIRNNEFNIVEEVQHLIKYKKELGETIVEEIKNKANELNTIIRLIEKKQVDISNIKKSVDNLKGENFKIDYDMANAEIGKTKEELVRVEGYNEKLQNYKKELLNINILKKELVKLMNDYAGLKGFNAENENKAEKIIDLIQVLEASQNESDSVDDLKDKGKTDKKVTLITGGVAILTVIAGFFVNPLISPFVFIAAIIILGISVLNIVKSKKNIKEINKIAQKKQKTTNEIKKHYTSLYLISKAFENKTLSDIKEIIIQFRSKKSDLVKIETQINDKEKALLEYNIDDIKSKKEFSDSFIKRFYEKYNSNDVESVERKLAKYRNLENSTKEDSGKLDMLTNEINDLKKDGTIRNTDIKDEISMTYENHFLNMEQREQKVEERIKYFENEKRAVEHAIENMSSVFERFHTRFGADINKASGLVLNKLTNGKYSEMLITKEFDVKLKDEESKEIKSAEFFSNGTWDQIYFSLRMGIINSINEKTNKKVPLFLDDAFIQYDDKRLQSALEYLHNHSKDNQILLFTCQKREVEISRTFENINIIEI